MKCFYEMLPLEVSIYCIKFFLTSFFLFNEVDVEIIVEEHTYLL
jgi:hypothetical protein